MAARRTTIRRRAVTGSVLALTFTAIAFAVAVIATANSGSYGSDLSDRLVPSAAATDNLLSQFNVQQTSLRNAVTHGRADDLSGYFDAGTQWRVTQGQLSELAGGNAAMTSRLHGVESAHQAWLTEVAEPQVVDLNRGDVATAQAAQADSVRNSPLVLAVRTTGLALQDQVISEQRAVTGSLDTAHDTLLGALIAMIVAVAAMAAAVISGVWRGMLRPFDQLNRAVAAVAEGRYHRSIPTVGPAELADMSRGVERMRTRLVSALSERERAEENLRSLFDLAPDAMIAVARDGVITMANAQAVQVFGYPAHELVGGHSHMLVPSRYREDLARYTRQYFTDRRSRPQGQEVKAVGLRRDGSKFPAEVRVSLLPTDDGTVMIVAVRDITERLAMEAERERLRAAAEQERLQRRQAQSQRLESLGQLIGGVAHDFNNLLNVISGYAEFTAEQLQPLVAEDRRLEPVAEDVEQVRNAAQQAIRVTRQLLTFAKSDAVHREVLDLNEVVDSAGQLLHRSLGTHIELVIAAEPSLWAVEADRGQLEQVLVNLAVNARDAMPGGGRLTIATGNAEVDEAYAEQRPNLRPGRYCRLAVADTGSGMDAATIERVFEPFFSTKPRGRGTGLGLATVYGIVSGQGGTIDVYSEVGMGTTMNVLLPVTEQVASAQLEPDLPLAGLRGRGEAILLVEDEDSLRVMASRILARNGYQVREAPDGPSALERAADTTQRLDLLITDMVMPGMLGNEVVDRMREIRPGVPVVFITGYAQQVLDFHGIPAPELDIVQKPFTESALLTGVRRALNRAGVPRQADPIDPSARPARG